MELENYSLKIEADEVIKEITFAVNYIEVSTVLNCTDALVFLNLKTKEDEVFCVELSAKGFRIISKEYDQMDITDSPYYETIYALLDTVSPGYRNAFSEALTQKLQGL